jgi:hypothetical protein
MNHTLAIVLRSAAIVAACVAAIAYCGVADLKAFAGDRDVRAVWVHNAAEYKHYEKADFPAKLFCYNTRTDNVTQICPGADTAAHNYTKPLFTPSGNSIVYTIPLDTTVYTCDLEGKNRRRLGKGFAACTRRIEGMDWVYIWHPEKSGATWAVNLGDTSEKVLMWDKCRIGNFDPGHDGGGQFPSSWFSVSGDGKRAIDGGPWPDIKIFQLPNVEVIGDDRNCWPSMSPDATYHYFIWNEDHNSVRMYDATFTKIADIDFGNWAGWEFCNFPKWSANDPGYVLTVGPGLEEFVNAIYLGKLQGWTSVSQWKKVTPDSVIGCYYPDIFLGEVSELPFTGTSRGTVGQNSFVPFDKKPQFHVRDVAPDPAPRLFDFQGRNVSVDPASTEGEYPAEILRPGRCGTHLLKARQL